MSDLEIWSSLVGALLPLVIAFFMRSSWDNYTKIALTVALCFVAALGTVFLQGELNPSNFVHSALIVIALTWSTYQIVWKPSTIAPRIEAAVPI